MKSLKETDKERIINLLKSSTEARPITARQLSNQCSRYEDGTAPQTRGLIRELISEGYPIASNRKGYYMIRSGKQMQKYMNDLAGRIAGISQRIHDVYTAYIGGK